MNESHVNQPAHAEVLIDRLAAGELEDAARRELFAWLDGEPRRWRRCALALLEARELDQALADWKAEIPRTPPVRRVGTAHHVERDRLAPHTPRRRLVHALALAASLLLAFGLGVGARGFWREPSSIAARTSPEHKSDTATSAGSLVSAGEPKKVSPAGHTSVPEASASNHPARDLIPPYVRSQLQRRGYEVESRHALVPAVLPDGRRVMLPVDQFQLRYVGHRTS